MDAYIISMGCVQDSTISQNNADILKMLVVKIKLSCEVDKKRQAGELQKLEKLLLAEFSKPIKTRSRQLERSMIDNNLVYYATSIILMMVENHARILQEHKNFFDDPKQLPVVQASLNMLLYCMPILNKDDLNQFSAIFRKKYPSFVFPSDNDMEQFVRKFKLTRTVSAQNQRQYIFSFCNKYDISAETINQAGHSYKYSNNP